MIKEELALLAERRYMRSMTDEYFNLIQQQCEQVISYSQGISGVNCKPLLERWLRAKERFIDAFGGQLILDCGTVTVPLPEKQKISTLAHFITWAIDKPGNEIENKELQEFLLSQSNGLLKNKIVSNYTAKKQVSLPIGMSLSKALKYFISDKDALYEVQNELSRLIQLNKMTGRLCLSVHPLDFLSISETAYNWRSCHALDGEYRSGNLSYMVDKVTFIAYVKGEEDKILPRFPREVPWNSKKWRTLLFLSPDDNLIFAGRSYPFSCLPVLNEILHNCLPFCGFSLKGYTDWMEAKENYIHNNTFNTITLNDCTEKIIDVVSDEYGSLQYNDLIYSTCYLPLYAYKKEHDYKKDLPRILVGGSVKCLRCDFEWLNSSQEMFCDSCL